MRQEYIELLLFFLLFHYLSIPWASIYTHDTKKLYTINTPAHCGLYHKFLKTYKGKLTLILINRYHYILWTPSLFGNIFRSSIRDQHELEAI